GAHAAPNITARQVSKRTSFCFNIFVPVPMAKGGRPPPATPPLRVRRIPQRGGWSCLRQRDRRLKTMQPACRSLELRVSSVSGRARVERGLRTPSGPCFHAGPVILPGGTWIARAPTDGSAEVSASRALSPYLVGGSSSPTPSRENRWRAAVSPLPRPTTTRAHRKPGCRAPAHRSRQRRARRSGSPAFRCTRGWAAWRAGSGGSRCRAD
ncbi:MAG: hypothetical protein JWO86_5770, partial [Myxococcaceae bacterium]|nr:hypothetical protein [Myxococcaceae bacterium]